MERQLYSNTAARQLRKDVEAYKESPIHNGEMVQWCAEALETGIKFLLPNGGRILNDKLKGLPDQLNLPYPVTILEYPVVSSNPSLAVLEYGIENTVIARKRVALAYQMAENIVAVFSIYQQMNKHSYEWILYPTFACVFSNKSGAIDQSLLKRMPISDLVVVKEDVGIMYQPIHASVREVWSDWELKAAMDLSDEVNAVLELIEVLACKNVRSDTAFKRKGKSKAPCKQDLYKILTVGHNTTATVGNEEKKEQYEVRERTSPREHLRMGHIRRYADHQIFIQPTIVNPGVGGKVTKGYLV
jgi:hypothetical protein